MDWAELFNYMLLSVTSLFVVIDPIATAPAFLAMTPNDSAKDRVRMARLATIVIDPGHGGARVELLPLPPLGQPPESIAPGTMATDGAGCTVKFRSGGTVLDCQISRTAWYGRNRFMIGMK